MNIEIIDEVADQEGNPMFLVMDLDTGEVFSWTASRLEAMGY